MANSSRSHMTYRVSMRRMEWNYIQIYNIIYENYHFSDNSHTFFEISSFSSHVWKRMFTTTIKRLNILIHSWEIKKTLLNANEAAAKATIR